MLLSSLILPHPPAMIPSVGGEEGLKPIAKTIQSMIEVSRLASELKPDTVVILGPHGPVYPDAISVKIPEDGRLKGTFQMFGSDECLQVESDNVFANQIIDSATEAGLKTIAIPDSDLDHGVFAPMYYLDKAIGDYKMVSINISFAGYRVHFDFGKVLKKIFEESDRRVLFIASADLSHSLTQDAPAGFTEEGKEFDDRLVELMKVGKTEDILDFDPFWVDEANECGLRSICTALGVAEKYKVHSYEGPYGVGYMVASSY